MGLDFSFSDVKNFFSDTGEKLSNSFENTANKISNKFEENKEEFIDFTENFTSNAKELINETADKLEEKFDSLTETASQKFSEVSSILEKFVDEVPEKTGAVITKAKTEISEFAAKAYDWAKDAENWKKLGASVANGAISLVKGVVGLVEAIGDAALIVGAAGGTLFTGAYDLVKGLTTGEWNWEATKEMWDGTKAITTYGWTNELANKFYATEAGKTLDAYAYTPFKSDGTGCKITEGIGYAVGIILLSIATAGVGGAAAAGGTSATAVSSFSALFAGTAGLGKYTAEEWNKNDLVVEQNGQESKINIDYHKYLEITELGDGKSTTFEQQVQLEDGSITTITYIVTRIGNEYNIVDEYGNPLNFKGVTESSTGKGLAVGTIKAGWEAFQYWLGGKIGTGSFSKLTGNITNPVAKEATKSAIRVGLDALTGIAEVPFQSVVTAYSEDMSLKEAFEASGGWEAVKSQAIIASILSFGGEALSFKGNVLDTKVKTSAEVKDAVQLQETIENSNLNNTKIINNLDESQPTIAKSLDTEITMANYHTGKGRFYTIDVDNIDNVSKELLGKINDPSSVNFKIGDQTYSYLDVKQKIGLVSSSTNVNIKSLDDQIAMANYHGSKGITSEIKINKLDDLTLEKLDNIKNPNNTLINLDGKQYSVLEIKEKINAVDLEEELAFFDNIGKYGKNKHIKLSEIDPSITPVQKQTIDEINAFIRNGQSCTITYNSTSEISSAMLNQIDDLSMVKIKLLDGLGDAAGSLKGKYLGKQRYIDRVTYNGYEMKSILERIEDLQSKIDMNLPVEQRAKQIFDIVSSEVPVMRDYASYTAGHHVSASLRGIIPDNLVGKEGLVCAGYASLYKELCDRVGIRCDYVRGIGIIDPLRNGSRGGHAWNVVYTEKGMIPVDVTWNASGNGTKNWFGGSDEFIQTHIADPDELSKDFVGMIPSIMFEGSDKKLNKVLSILDNKYGSRDESIKRLQKYLSDGDANIITRTDDARNIISTVDEQSLKTFVEELDINNKIKEAINTMNQKNGAGYGIKALDNYLKTGNLNLITRTNDARGVISKISLENIQKYLQEFGG